MKTSTITTKISVGFLTLFTAITLFMTTSIFFDWFGIRAKEGNYVLFIVWANFIAGLLYLFAIYGFIKKSKWAFRSLMAALGILCIAFIALLIYINKGGVYEFKTVMAMIFRMTVTLVLALVAFFNINKRLKIK